MAVLPPGGAGWKCSRVVVAPQLGGVSGVGHIDGYIPTLWYFFLQYLSSSNTSFKLALLSCVI